MSAELLKQSHLLETMNKQKYTSYRANELDGYTWLKYSISIWDDIQKTGEEKKLPHPAVFPKELPKRIMEIFLTKEKTEVLDPFMGTGSTLVACKELGKHGIGFEICEEYVKVAQERLKNCVGDVEQTIFLEDARNITKYLLPESIDLVITSPPYWNVLQEKRSADRKPTRDYLKNNQNLGQIESYSAYLAELSEVFKQVYIVLKRNAYCVINVMDLRKKSKFYPLHVDVIRFMTEIGFTLDDIIIWDRRKDYNSLRPLGYPYVFRINKVHEYLLIFHKR